MQDFKFAHTQCAYNTREKKKVTLKRHLIHKKLLILAIVFFYVFSASALKRQDGVSSQFPYVFLLSDSVVVPLPISDEDFYTHAQGVVFPVNKYSIPENNAWLRELQNKVEPWAREHGLELKYIELRGAASPEGPLDWNTRLATKRSASLRDTLRTIFAVNYDLVSPTTPQHPEDYSALIYQMRKKNDPDLALVEGIVKQYDDDRAALKKELQTQGGGRLWRRLLREYFPNIRAARVVLYFKYRDDTRKSKAKTDIEPVLMLDSVPFTRKELEDLLTAKVENIPLVPLEIQSTNERIPRRELLSVKTNLLFDFAYMPFGYNDFCPIPNVAIEYYPLHGHFTYGAMFDCPWWKGGVANHKYFQARNYTAEMRYYFRSGDVDKRGIGNGAAFKGVYLSAYANAAMYGIGWGDKKDIDVPGTMDGHGWMGEGAGAGLGVGYVVPLSKKGHWRLELSAQFGVFWTKYDPYVFGCPVENVKDGLYYYDYKGDADLFKKREYMLTWLGPTRVGVTISYDLLYRHNNKRRASFRAWEKGGSR